MLLQLDFGSDVPIYMQIRNQIVLGIADGRLQPGERLPTIRALANECGVNTMTVNKAYARLKQEAFIEADRRSGAVVRMPAGVRRAGDESLPRRAQEALRLAIAEAKLAGMNREALVELCGRLYDEGV